MSVSEAAANVDTHSNLSHKNALDAGDAGAWSIMMQRLILSSHLILDGLFLGLEGDTYTNIRSARVR